VPVELNRRIRPAVPSKLEVNELLRVNRLKQQ
jgi:hypothetical protein